MCRTEWWVRKKSKESKRTRESGTEIGKCRREDVLKILQHVLTKRGH